MKLLCDKALLVSALSNVTRAVSSKSPIMALEGILLYAQDGRLTMTGYDLEMGIITYVEADIQKEGRIVLSARLLFDMVRGIPSDRISIESDEKFLTVIQGGATEYTILGIDPDDYPELPSVTDGKTVALPQEILKSMISQTLYAVATSDSKPVHKGSLFDIRDRILSLVSVDGYRLAMRREKVTSGEDMEFIVPGKTLAEVSKLVKEEEDAPDAELLLSRRHIIFKIGQYHVISRLLEGDFLDYRAAIPSGETSVAVVSVRELIESVERTSLLISDKLRSPLRVSFEKEQIQINCTTSIGRAYDSCGCSLTGNEVEMGFNNRYLLDALKAAGCDQVRLLLGGPLSPMRIVPMEDEDFLFLVLPVRLKAE